MKLTIHVKSNDPNPVELASALRAVADYFLPLNGNGRPTGGYCLPGEPSHYGVEGGRLLHEDEVDATVKLIVESGYNDNVHEAYELAKKAVAEKGRL